MERLQMKTGGSYVTRNRSQFRSETEQAVVQALSHALPGRFDLEYVAEAIEISLSENEGLPYVPLLSIRDPETGTLLPVEVLTSQALVLANVVMLKHIVEAYKDRGQEFALIVWGGDTHDAVKKKRLLEQGIEAIWIRDQNGIAPGIEHFLAASIGARDRVRG
jgi:hypothetical protein